MPRIQPALTLRRLGVLAALAGFGLACLARADDWTNAGGNAGRNGLTTERGPDALGDLSWSGGRSSIIAWQPVVAGSRVFTVRQTGFPPEPASDESPVVAVDLNTGVELWSRNIPASASDWTTWVAGVSGGKVYVARTEEEARAAGWRPAGTRAPR